MPSDSATRPSCPRVSFERGAAQRARVIGIAVLRVLAVDRAVQDARHAGLARAARAGEQVRVRRPAELDRVPERARDVLLADDVPEAFRTPPQIERAVRLSCGVGGRRLLVEHQGYALRVARCALTEKSNAKRANAKRATQFIGRPPGPWRLVPGCADGARRCARRSRAAGLPPRGQPRAGRSPRAGPAPAARIAAA